MDVMTICAEIIDFINSDIFCFNTFSNTTIIKNIGYFGKGIDIDYKTCKIIVNVLFILIIRYIFKIYYFIIKIGD